MKNRLLILLLTLLFISCIHDKGIYTGMEKRVAYCEAFEDYEVPVKAGYTSIVIYENDTLAVVSEPTTIKVPKGSSITTKSDTGIRVDFVILNQVASYSAYWQAVMFEDTENGDYDYNDLIIHVKNFISNGGKDWDLQNIYIQPIALGNTKKIKLGCLLPDHSEHIIAEDVRTELFSGEKGFINTVDSITPIRYKLIPRINNYKLPKGTRKTIAWFIEVENGKKFYAVTSDYDYQQYDMFNAEGIPYGLVVAKNNGTFKYPRETFSIFQVYPGFGAWINGASDIGTPVPSLTSNFCKNTIPDENGKMHTIWDYQDLE